MAFEGDSAFWKKSALIIIGMQHDFVDQNSPFSLKGVTAILPAIKQAISFARDKGALIVWMTREHHRSGGDVELFRRHKYTGGRTGPAIKGTKGAAFFDGFEPRPEDHVIAKSRFSAFFGTNLHLVLQAAGVQNVTVIGTLTPNCIRQTIFDAVAYDYPRPMVIRDACAATTIEINEANLLDMRNVKIATPSLAEWMLGVNM